MAYPNTGIDDRPWWTWYELCNGLTKKGKRCKRRRMPAYEIEPGNLYIPTVCNLHTEQEYVANQARLAAALNRLKRHVPTADASR